jgi:hypothetical protein
MNHPPIVKLNQNLNLSAKPGSKIRLTAHESYDPDGDELKFKWWYYREASDYDGEIILENAQSEDVTIEIPADITQERGLHLICEVSDSGSPQLTRYKRVMIKVEP